MRAIYLQPRTKREKVTENVKRQNVLEQNVKRKRASDETKNQEHPNIASLSLQLRGYNHIKHE